MNIWQGKLVRLRAYEPGDGQLLFEMSQDSETQGLFSTRGTRSPRPDDRRYLSGEARP
jgi:hypothetical protein